MDAFFARNRLSAYLDGSLSEGEAAEVEAALARDPALHADFEAMKRAVTLLRQVGPRTAPPDLHSRIMARVAREPKPVARLAWLRRPLSRLPVEGLALAAAALLVVVAIQWKPGQEQAPLPPVKDPVAQVEPQQNPATPATTVEQPAPTAAEPTPKTVDLGTAVPVAPHRTPTTVTAPETPYQAPWEQPKNPTSTDAKPASSDPGLESALSSGVSMRTPLYYRLTTQDPEVLQALAGIASNAGGQLKRGSGDGSAATTLTNEQNYATVSLVVPPGSLGEVTTAIKGLGAIANPPPAKGPLFAADQVIVVLDVQYNP